MKRTLYLSLFLFCLSACNNNQSKIIIAAQEAVLVDSIPGECPYLTRDNNGNAVLSWVRLINDSTTAFCYAIGTNGKNFSQPVVVPNSNNIEPHSENLPKIIFKPSGEIIALWGAANPNPKNKHSGLVFYTQSFDNGKTWTKSKPLVNDTASYDQRYYDVALLPNGEAAIIWLDNRKTTTKEGSALYYSSTHGKNGFEGEKLISENCCQCCRTDLYIDKSGSIHAVFRGIVQDSIRDMVHVVSMDGGVTFSRPKRINEDNWVLKGCPHTGPAITENANGLHFAWFTGGKNKGCYYTSSDDNGKNFTGADSISAKGSHPQLTSLANGEIIIVWDEKSFFNNKIVNRIAIQQRSASGKSEQRDFITPPNSNGSYPVIIPANETSIVAYSTNKDGEDYVCYQVIKLQ